MLAWEIVFFRLVVQQEPTVDKPSDYVATRMKMDWCTAAAMDKDMTLWMAQGRPTIGPVTGVAHDAVDRTSLQLNLD